MLAFAFLNTSTFSNEFDWMIQVEETPYDQHIEIVRNTLENLNGDNAKFSDVEKYMKEIFAFKYVFDAPYIPQPPNITLSKRAGDCKAKSVLLAYLMNDKNVIIVIGKARRNSIISHMWLMWKYKDTWWILDPTNVSEPIPMNCINPNDYVPSYLYSKTGSYVNKKAFEKKIKQP